MKNCMLLAITMFLFSFATAQMPTDTLTNDKIIQLSKIGLQPTVLINKIKTSFCSFDVSTDGLIRLSSNGVSSDVINEMMNSDVSQRSALADQKDRNDPMTKRATGIYYYNPQDPDNMLRRVDPTVMSVNKSGGFGSALAMSMTYGLASDKMVSTISGANSRMKIDKDKPVFYFYFDGQEKAGRDNWFFATATSPNEFDLARLTEKSSSREISVGSANAYGSTVGVSSSDKVDFDYVEEGDGIYKVTFNQPLPKGEYCFLYKSATPTSYSNDKVFDFSITVGQPASDKVKSGKRNK